MTDREDIAAVCEKLTVIGLIGDIAGGKSTVAEKLSELGVSWINADRLAHRCLRLRTVRNQLQEKFGKSILGENGSIDRRRLAKAVFEDDAQQSVRVRWLESVVHPPTRLLVLRRMKRLVHDQQRMQVAVLDAPLLLEAGWDSLCDEIWCVCAPWELRVRWVASRGWTEKELLSRQSQQWSVDKKRARSSIVLENNGNLDELRIQTERLFENRIRNGL
jgi:dephospho-CoA kinase